MRHAADRRRRRRRGLSVVLLASVFLSGCAAGSIFPNEEIEQDARYMTRVCEVQTIHKNLLRTDEAYRNQHYRAQGFYLEVKPGTPEDDMKGCMAYVQYRRETFYKVTRWGASWFGANRPLVYVVPVN